MFGVIWGEGLLPKEHVSFPHRRNIYVWGQMMFKKERKKISDECEPT